MDKTTKRGAVWIDDRRPSKPAAPATGKRVRASADDAVPPSYAGVAKTDTAPAAKRTRGASRSKAAAGTLARPRAGSTPTEWDDQVPPRTRRRAMSGGGGAGGDAGAAGASGDAGASGEQYIRLRVRMRGERLSIVDSHLVDGPLGQAQGFSTTNVYDISLDDRLLHAGALPDLGVQRSFVNPDGPPEQQGHHFTDRPIVEFTARVPAHEVTAETVSRIVLRVHRVKEEARTDRLGVAPLAEQFARQVRPTAELVGLPASVLPEAIQARGGRTPTV